MDPRQIAMKNIDAAAISDFRAALLQALSDPTSGFGKAYLNLLVDEVRLEGNELRIKGSFGKLADTVGHYAEGQKK